MDSPWEVATATAPTTASTTDDGSNDEPDYETLPNPVYDSMSSSPPVLQMDSPWEVATDQSTAATTDDGSNDEPVYKTLPNPIYDSMSSSPPVLQMNNPWEVATATDPTTAATTDNGSNDDPDYETLPNPVYDSLSAVSTSPGGGEWMATAGTDPVVAAAVSGGGAAYTDPVYDSLSVGPEYDFLSTDFGAEVSPQCSPATKMETPSKSAAGSDPEPMYERLDDINERVTQRQRILALKELSVENPYALGP